VVLIVAVAVVGQCAAVNYSPVYTSINERDFGYYVPATYDPSTPTPLLFMFHGLGGNHSQASGGSAENGYYGWQTTAYNNGFIVLFPDSEPGAFNTKTWNLGANGSSPDLPFIDDMIGWATANYNINESRIFTTGHSWGAYFSYYVARYRADKIAAFGEHSGGLGGFPLLGYTPPVPSGPDPEPKLNGILLHAVDDGLVSYSNSQSLYDDLNDNGHNTYPGIIQVDGWGPDNHRYRLAHNQTQWDFFLSVTPTPGDTNGDDVVDTDDYDNLVAQFGGPPGADTADFNRDGVVDLVDFSIMRNNFGFGLASAPNAELASPIPEPATLALLAAGGMALIRRRRRK